MNIEIDGPSYSIAQTNPTNISTRKILDAIDSDVLEKLLTLLPNILPPTTQNTILSCPKKDINHKYSFAG